MTTRLLRSSFVVLAATLAGACSSSETPPNGDAPPALDTTPAVTEIATPTGDPARGNVGPSGGTLTSADGRLTLEFPAGALAADTEITITPIGNVAPGAVSSYRLGPEGVTFGAPVTVRFAVSEDDLRGTSEDAFRIATQTSERSWRVFADAVFANGSLTAQTTHFSDYSLVMGWQIRPPSGTVKVKQKQELTVRYCGLTEADLNGEVVPIAARCQENDEHAPLIMKPAVNAIGGGNAEVGTVSLDGTTLTYTAPASVPSSNPVAVSIDLNSDKKPSTLVANLQIVDDAPKYTGTVSWSAKDDDGNFNYDARAEVTWQLKRSNSSQREYVATGSIHVNYTQTSPDCEPYEGTFPIEGGDMAIFLADAPMFASGYHFNIHAAPMVGLTCHPYEQPNETFVAEGAITLYMQAGFCDGATPAPYTDENLLKGSGPCQNGAIPSSDWEFRIAP